jgi:ferric-dicitrate binding protein FerR (iron transport regulator)
MRAQYDTRLAELTVKYLTDALSENERRELNELLNESDKNRALFREITSPRFFLRDLRETPKFDKEAAWKKAKEALQPEVILQQPFSEPQITHENPVYKLRQWIKNILLKQPKVVLWRGAIAAAVIVLVSVTVNLAYKANKGTASSATAKHVSGRKCKAFFHRLDGSVAPISETTRGIVGFAGYEAIIKKGLQIIYPKNRLLTNPIQGFWETAPGGYLEVILPDSSIIRLNSVSRIYYWDDYGDNARHNRMQGEAVFEVAKNKLRPFLVRADGMKVQALGTKFNVKAYRQENAASTTLIEGSVRLEAANKTETMRPGQKYFLRQMKDLTEVKDAAAVEQALGFTQRSFTFQGSDLPTIMAEIGRWYDYRVIYEGEIAARIYAGAISRSQDVDEILRFLKKQAGIHFTIDKRNKTITVKP